MSLTLFTNITEQLTELEQAKLVPLLLNALDTLPYGQRLTNKQLCHYLRSLNYQVSDVRIRKMVNYIRVMELVDDPWCLGNNMNGSPKHPLFIKTEVELQPYLFNYDTNS